MLGRARGITRSLVMSHGVPGRQRRMSRLYGEFLVDGVRVGAPDTTFPYSISWNTLDPLAGIFNGTHQVAAAVTDTSGQVYVTPASSVDVDNLAGNPWGISYTLNDPAITTDDVFPPAMTENTNPGVPTQDPYAGTTNPDGTSGGSLNRSLGSTPQDDGGTPPPTCPQGAYCPVVNVVNTSGTAWSDSTAQVWYRWYAPNGAIMFEGRSTTAFPSSFGKNATQAFPLTIYPPALPPGATQGTFRLRVDVFDPASGIWFAARGTPPMDNPIIVVKSLATKLGLERFYQNDGEAVGAVLRRRSRPGHDDRPDVQLAGGPLQEPGRQQLLVVDERADPLRRAAGHPSEQGGPDFRAGQQVGGAHRWRRQHPPVHRHHRYRRGHPVDRAGRGEPVPVQPARQRPEPQVGVDPPGQGDVLLRRRRVPHLGGGPQRQPHHLHP